MPRFREKGGACKHICAAVLRLDNLREHGLNLPAIRLPSSAEDARALQARQFSNLLASNENAGTLVPTAHSPIEKAAIATEDALRESEDAYLVEPDSAEELMLIK